MDGPITISGSSEITGFGNATWITVEDVTNPADPVVIAGFNPADPVPTPSASNSTNALGNFSIPFNPADYYTTNGHEDDRDLRHRQRGIGGQRGDLQLQPQRP